MTVEELIAELKKYPRDAEVFASLNDGDDVYRTVEVTASEDAPNKEVYIEVAL